MRTERPSRHHGGPNARTRALLVFTALGALLAALLHDPGASVTGRPVAAPAGTSTSPPPSSSPSRTAEPAPAPDPCAVKAEALPLRARLAQLLMVGVDPRGTADALRVVQAEQVGGIFIGGEDTGLLTGGLDAVRAAAALPLMVAVDDEGGRVQRVDALDGSLPSARRMAADMTPEQVRALARDRARALRARGVSMDLAPVVD
ncbi:glycoside hydrolase family 3 N-terminal domain-containing protein, partial [Actinosynnema sp. NPDC059797]